MSGLRSQSRTALLLLKYPTYPEQSAGITVGSHANYVDTRAEEPQKKRTESLMMAERAICI